MSGVALDCFVCDGYEKYKGKPCHFCHGTGMHYICQDAIKEFMESAEEYKKFIDNGNDPSDWEEG
jgi:hypothetical protein